MGQVVDFFKKLFDITDFPPRWHCGRWTDFHGWLYIISDLLIWSAYFTIPLIIIKYITKKHDARFIRLYVLFAGFILACGATHFLDALIFWVPLYRLSALVKLITGILSWITVWYLFKLMPVAFSLRSVDELEKEIEQRKIAENEVRRLNEKLEDLVWQKIQETVATESRFRSIIEHSSEAISLMDETFTPFYLNPVAELITGSGGGAQWREKIHPDDAGRLQQILSGITPRNGQTVTTSLRVLNSSGNYLWLEGTITNMLAHPHVKAVVFNFRDVTERKEIEEKLVESEKIYHSIAANLPNAIITIVDHDNKFILAEGEGLYKTGQSTATLIGKTQEDSLDSEAYAKVKEFRKRAFEGEVILHETEYKDVQYLVRYIPLRNEQQEVYAVITISLDVTDIKKAGVEINALNESLEKKVAERTNQLEAANKEMEAFSYSVSHDLRAPLRIIHGYADILKMDHAASLDSEGHRLLGVIVNNIRQMGVLIDELLKLSRLGKKEINLRTTNMIKLVHDVLREQPMDITRIKFKINDLPDALCDGILMKYVWTNLISNAIKYSGKSDTPEIEISAVTEDDHVVYALKDNGIGFDMKYSHKLFGVFQRLHKKSEFEGTGVGLALVQRIITRHNGKVWAEAEENKGATFYFSLPQNTDHETVQS